MNEWEQRYQTGETPWDKGAPAPGLVDWLAAHPQLARGTVLVPGCGTGHDAREWARHGFTVTGYDIAPSAVQRAQSSSGAAGLSATFKLGDFLNDEPGQHFDWIFEHTCFCAIQPAQREAYVRAVQRWLKPGGQFIAVHYMIPDTDGPPFGTTRDEVVERFSPHFHLLEEWVPNSYANRTGKELMLWWQRKGATQA
jgi:SAM-dependent methyltransferase